MKSINKKGTELLSDSVLNKGTAFSAKEREVFGLEGYLPIGVDNQQNQMLRIKEHLDAIDDDVYKSIYLSQLQDRNETLYYSLLMSDPARYLPIVYDPTVGSVCLKFSHLYRKPRGLYLSLEHRGKIKKNTQ